jgi:hypothetical protein
VYRPGGGGGQLGSIPAQTELRREPGSICVRAPRPGARVQVYPSAPPPRHILVWSFKAG